MISYCKGKTLINLLKMSININDKDKEEEEDEKSLSHNNTFSKDDSLDENDFNNK